MRQGDRVGIRVRLGLVGVVLLALLAGFLSPWPGPSDAAAADKSLAGPQPAGPTSAVPTEPPPAPAARVDAKPGDALYEARQRVAKTIAERQAPARPTPTALDPAMRAVNETLVRQGRTPEEPTAEHPEIDLPKRVTEGPRLEQLPHAEGRSAHDPPAPDSNRQPGPQDAPGPVRSGPASAPPDAQYGVWYSWGNLSVVPTYAQPGYVWVSLTNRSNYTWLANSSFALGYHLYRADGSLYNYLGTPTALTSDVPVGATTQIYARIERLPAGSFKLVWDVQDDGVYYVDRGVPAATPMLFTLPHQPPSARIYDPPYDATYARLDTELSIGVYGDDSRPIDVQYELCPQGEPAKPCQDSGWLRVGTPNSGFTVYHRWRPPAAVMTWNTTYLWRIRVRDDSATTPWSEQSRYSTVVPAVEGANRLGIDPAAVDPAGVGLYRGNYTRQEKDMSIPARGGALEIARVYNSANPKRGVFGVGWSSILDMTSILEPDGFLRVTYPDGRQVRYGRNPDGGWVPAFGESAGAEVTGQANLRTSDGTEYRFGVDGRITEIVGASGGIHYFTYDTSGRLQSIRDGLDTWSRGLYFGWLGADVTHVADNAGGSTSDGGRFVNYNHDNAGYLTGVCDVRLACGTYEYNDHGSPTAEGRLTKSTRPDPKNHTKVSYTGDFVETVTFADGALWRYVRGPAATPDAAFVVAVTDPNQLRTSYAFNARASLLYRWTGTGPSTETNTKVWGYNAYGLPSSTLDENGNVTETYWTAGRPTGHNAYRDANTIVNTHIRNHLGLPGDPLNGQPEMMQDANRHQTTYAYVPASAGSRYSSLVQSSTAADGGITRFTYTCVAPEAQPPVVNDPQAPAGAAQPCGLARTRTDPDGRTTRYEYNRFGDVTRTTTPTGLVTDVFHNRTGQPVEQRVDGAVTTLTYDALGNVETVTEPAVTNSISGATHRKRTTNRRDVNGNLLEVRVADLTPPEAGGDGERLTVYTYDVRDRRTTVTSGGIYTGSIVYGYLGEVRTSYDPVGTRYDFLYDAQTRLTDTWLRQFSVTGTDPRDIRISARRYDPGGRLSQVADAMSHWVGYTYTPDGLRLTETLRGFQDPVTNTTRDIPLRTYTYDAAGNVVKDVQGAGTASLVTTSGYDAVNRSIGTVLDPGGLNRVTTTGYSKAGAVTSTVLSDGSTTADTTRQIYDAAGQLVATGVRTMCCSGESVTAFKRDRAGRLLATTDPRGVPAIGSTDPPNPAFTTEQAYDLLGRVRETVEPPAAVEDGDGAAPRQVRATTTIGYDTFGEVTHERDALGRVTVTEYNAQGRRVKVTYPQMTNPDGSVRFPVEQWTYDRVGNPIRHQDRHGRTTTMKYDARNRMFQLIEPAASEGASPYTVTSTHDDNGNVVARLDSLGAQQLWTYDGMDRTRTATALQRLPGGWVDRFTTTYTSDDLGRVLRVDTPGGQSTAYTYTADGQVRTETVRGHGSTTHSYDIAGRLRTTVDPVGRTVVNLWDVDGKLLETVAKAADGAPAGEKHYEYDAAGNATRVGGERGGTLGQTFQSREYDASGRVIALSEGVDRAATQVLTTRFGYDAVGNRTRVTDAAGRATYTTYNTWNLPSTRREPVTAAHPAIADRTWSTSYDVAGYPTVATEPGGVVRRFEYDGLGRTVRESGTGADKATERTFGYDAAGRVTHTRSGTAETMYEYDDRGLMTLSTGHVGQTRYTYDGDGRVKSSFGPAVTDGVSWYYENSDLVSVGDTISQLTRRYTRDAAGRVTGEEQTRGIRELATRSYTYDAAGRVDTDTMRNPAGGVTAKQTFRWDLEGNLLGSTTEGEIAGARNREYTYDQAGRLSSDFDPTAQTGTDYTWDEVGNRKAATKWEGTRQSHVATGGSSFGYDERNRLVQASDPVAGTTDYTWDANGTLARTTRRAVGVPVSTADQSFDAFGRLTADGTASYEYDALDRLTTSRNTDAASHRRFGYNGFDKEPATDGRWWFTRSGDTVLGARDGPPETTFAARESTADADLPSGAAPAYGVLTNAHQDAIALIDPTTGAISGSRSYDAFGKVTASAGAQAPIGFQGSWTDETTGRVQAQARWYDPTTGSFASGDTAAVPMNGSASTNRYGYGEGNPTSTWDPTGHFLKIPGTPSAAALRHMGSKSISLAGNVVKSAAKPVARAGLRVAMRGAVLAVASVLTPEVLLVVGAVVLVALVTGVTVWVVVNMDGSTTPVRDPEPLDKPADPPADPQPTCCPPPPPPAEPPPPPPPYITGTATTTSRKAWSTVDKYFDSTFAYERTDWYRYTETHKWNQWSTGDTTSGGWSSLFEHYWKTIARRLIDLDNALRVEVSQVPDSAKAPDLPSGAPLAGTCGAGGSTASCGSGPGPGDLHLIGDCSGRFGADAMQDCHVEPAPGDLGDPNTRLSKCRGVTGAGSSCLIDNAPAGTPSTGADPSCHSFPAGTGVLMADGTTKAIQDVKPGDTVLATDPESGESAPRTVLAAITTEDDKNFADITVATDQGDASIIATVNHPFWAPDLKQWINAGDLHPGQLLQTATGTWVQVGAVRYLHGRQRTHDLTVDVAHSYYVSAGTAPVLVHNCDVDYGSIDALGQRSGIVAIVTPQTAQGTKANRDPPGYAPNVGLSRGHLLPKALGGSGTVESNLVTTTARVDNGPMNELEKRIAAHVFVDGKTILYSSTPRYHPGQDVPYAVTIEAFDDDGWYEGETFFQ
ncbi:RHS repeat-associated core domain-containing protein [Embleya sp. NPDC059259]|uniref:RHS repeat-associated core domain-containing protein n=1 Tax=unclassified Embleya TaxID=2699296 RepID=UPI0036C7B637